MRFITYVAVIAFFTIGFSIAGCFTMGTAHAQSSPVYNANPSNNPSDQGKSPIYNSSLGGGTAPLFLGRTSRGGNSSYSGSNTSYQSPYRASKKEENNWSVLSLTPAQIKAQQAEDRKRAQERLKLAQQQAEEQSQTTSSKKTAEYKKQFQGGGTEKRKKRRSTYLKNNSSAVPPPVFNRVN